MDKRLIGISLVFVVTIINTIGQYFLKLGSNNLVLNLIILQNYNLFIGLFLYGTSALLLIYALKFGDLNALYPLISLTFVWVTLISIFLLGEKLYFNQLLGTTSILTGVFLISKGAKK